MQIFPNISSVEWLLVNIDRQTREEEEERGFPLTWVMGLLVLGLPEEKRE